MNEILKISAEEITGSTFLGKPITSYSKKELEAIVCYLARKLDESRQECLRTLALVKMVAR